MAGCDTGGTLHLELLGDTSAQQMSGLFTVGCQEPNIYPMVDTKNGVLNMADKQLQILRGTSILKNIDDKSYTTCTNKNIEARQTRSRQN